MTRETEKQQERGVPSGRKLAWGLILSMADTTWRMFTPPAITVPMGIYADLKLQTRPWITVLSVVVGMSLSVLLVRQQLRGGQ